MSAEKFGEFVRRERGAKDIGLREMAKMIGLSPTYLSKVERDEFPPPVEDNVKAIAQIIKRDTDELLARRVACSRLVRHHNAAGFFAFLAGLLALAIFGDSRFLSYGADSTITPIFAGGLHLSNSR